METILIIEDNYDMRDNLTEYLEMEGYKILASDNAKEGIEFAGKFSPDLIICDVLMPHMNGYQVLSEILKSSKTKNIPFIFSTANSEKIDYEEAMQLGATDYIVKPFELEVLINKIKDCLELIRI